MRRSALFKTTFLALAVTAVCVMAAIGESPLDALTGDRPREKSGANDDTAYPHQLRKASARRSWHTLPRGLVTKDGEAETSFAPPLSPDDPLPGESPEAYRQRMNVVQGYETFVSEARLTGAEEDRLRHALADSQVNWRILRRFARHAVAAEEWPDDETRDQAEIEAVQEVDQRFADRHVERLAKVLRPEHLELLLREPRRFGMIHMPLALTFLRFELETGSI